MVALPLRTRTTTQTSTQSRNLRRCPFPHFEICHSDKKQTSAFGGFFFPRGKFFCFAEFLGYLGASHFRGPIFPSMRSEFSSSEDGSEPEAVRRKLAECHDFLIDDPTDGGMKYPRPPPILGRHSRALIPAFLEAVTSILPGASSDFYICRLGAGCCSWTPLSGPSLPPESSALERLFAHPATSSLIEAIDSEFSSKLGRLIPSSFQFHRRPANSPAFPPDIDEFSSAISRKLKFKTGSCCFCGLHGASPSCERCWSAGLSTVGIPVDLNLPIVISNGREPRAGHEYGLALRFHSLSLPKLELRRPKEDSTIIYECLELLLSDYRMYRAEACNSTLLFSHLRLCPEVEAQVELGLPQVSAPWRRVAGLGCVSTTKCSECESSAVLTTAMVTQWFEGPLSPGDVLTFYGNKLLTALKKWAVDKKSPLTGAGTVQKRFEPLVMFVTHFIFVVTDWLQDSSRWDVLVKNHDLRFLIRVFIEKSTEGLLYSEDPEMWLEIFACHHALFDRSHWPVPPGKEPPDVMNVISRLKKQRFENDIVIHTKFLWVWFHALRHKHDSPIHKIF